VSNALPNSLKVQIPNIVSGPTGFLNTGFWGIKIQDGWTYNGSFYAKSTSYAGKITASLVSSSGTVYASHTLSGISNDFMKFTFTLSPTSSAPTDDNYFLITVDGSEAAGQTLYFGLFSLFPPTWKGRANGMRIDLADSLAATSPTLWRFPGGNNLEGNSISTRWKWNETIGPLENRPGRIAGWGMSLNLRCVS
jgi:alpha-L-arabinofuranosidase